jgi:hypothetical protein
MLPLSSFVFLWSSLLVVQTIPTELCNDMKENRRKGKIDVLNYDPHVHLHGVLVIF